jgi:hypothetical protein
METLFYFMLVFSLLRVSWTQPDCLAAAAGHVDDVVCGGLRPRLGGIHRLTQSSDCGMHGTHP